jgi:hypothetical protein
MKHLLSIIFVVIVSLLQAQTLVFEGIILDKNTSESVPFVTLFSPETSQGVYSNGEGVFKFHLDKEVKTIEISSIGYKSLILDVASLEKGNVKVYLEVDEVVLDEVVLDEVIITNKPVALILEDLLLNSKKNLEKSIKLESYYREFVKVNDQYTKFADGLINFYLQPKRKTKIESKIVVAQSRAYQIKTAEDLEKKGKADLSALNSIFDIQKAASDFYDFSIIENFILSNKKSEFYDFDIRSHKDQFGKSLEVIVVKPKKDIEEILVEGNIVYDPINKIVLDIDIKIADDTKKFIKIRNVLLFKFAIYDLQIKQSYKYVNEKYIPSYKKTVADIYLKFGGQVNDRLKTISDLVVTKYDDTITSFPDESLLFKERSLYKNGMNFTTNFWETNNIIPLSESEEKIVKSLQIK